MTEIVFKCNYFNSITNNPIIVNPEKVIFTSDFKNNKFYRLDSTIEVDSPKYSITLDFEEFTKGEKDYLKSINKIYGKKYLESLGFKLIEEDGIL